MPALQIIRLPERSHLRRQGRRARRPARRWRTTTWRSAGSSKALSRSPFWKSTLVAVVEDDAQSGSDHVDSHRSVLLLLSAWNRPGVYHRFVNTTDVIATIEKVLKLGSLSQFDHFGRPVTELFAGAPDLSPYVALTPAVNLAERNPAGGRDARESAQLDLRYEDLSDEALFNRILWRMMKGDARPAPAARRMSSLEYARAR